MTSFVSAPIQPDGDALVTPAADGEPPLPAAFIWKGETLAVATLLRTWRSTKDDRGDTYLKRHWYEFETPDGSRAVVYFDRGAKRGAARWWLYTITRSSAP